MQKELQKTKSAHGVKVGGLTTDKTGCTMWDVYLRKTCTPNYSTALACESPLPVLSTAVWFTWICHAKLLCAPCWYTYLMSICFNTETGEIWPAVPASTHKATGGMCPAILTESW